MPKQPIEFVLHRHPYLYQCEHCLDRFEKPWKMDAQYERQLKASCEVSSPLPLFFECDFCHDDLVKPIGYHGLPSFTLNSDSGW
jgi:hypothetical protein